MSVKKLLSIVLGSLLLLIVLLIFALDLIVEWAVETEGSKALGARVELEAADVDLLAPAVTLLGLSVTNPMDTMVNAFEADTVKAEVSLIPLLSRRVIVDQAVVSGMRFQQPRATDGAIPGAQSPFAAGSSPGSALNQDIRLPTVDIPDETELLERLDLATVREAEALEAKIAERETYWRQRIDSLPNEDTLKNYERRLRAVRDEKDVLRRLAALQDANAVREEFQRDLRNLRDAASSLQADIKGLQSDIGRLQDAGTEDLDRAMGLVGLNPESLNQLARSLLGDEVGGWLDQGWYWYQQLQPMLAGAESGVPAEDAGTASAAPAILIRELLLDGEIGVPGGEPLSFRGEGQNLTDRADLWGVPAELQVQGAGSGVNLDISALLDHVDPAAARDVLNWEVEGLPLRDLTLSESASLPITFATAVLDASGQASLSQGMLDLRLDALFQALELATREVAGEGRSAQVGRAMQSALAGLETFDLTLLAEGPPNTPEITLQSSLNQAMSVALGSLLAGEQAQLEQRLNREIQGLVDERSRALGEDLRGLTGLDQEIEKLTADFGNLL